MTVPLTQRSTAIRARAASEGYEPITGSRKSILDSVRAALIRGVNLQLKRRDGSIFSVYSPVVIGADVIQFQSAAEAAQKPMVLSVDEIISVQPR